jgi:hypothetical protein
LQNRVGIAVYGFHSRAQIFRNGTDGRDLDRLGIRPFEDPNTIDSMAIRDSSPVATRTTENESIGGCQGGSRNAYRSGRNQSVRFLKKNRSLPVNGTKSDCCDTK